MRVRPFPFARPQAGAAKTERPRPAILRLSTRARGQEEATIMAGRIDKLLAERGIELPKAATPVANYVPVVLAGSLAFVAGQVTVWNGEFRFIGKLGDT